MSVVWKKVKKYLLTWGLNILFPDMSRWLVTWVYYKNKYPIPNSKLTHFLYFKHGRPALCFLLLTRLLLHLTLDFDIGTRIWNLRFYLLRSCRSDYHLHGKSVTHMTRGVDCRSGFIPTTLADDPPLTANLSLWFTASSCVALCLMSLHHSCSDK